MSDIREPSKVQKASTEKIEAIGIPKLLTNQKQRENAQSE